MKTKFVWPFAVFVVVMLSPLCRAQAGFLDDIMGSGSGYAQPYTYNATHSPRPQDSGAMQYRSPASMRRRPRLHASRPPLEWLISNPFCKRRKFPSRGPLLRQP